MNKNLWILLLCLFGWASSQEASDAATTSANTTGNKMPFVLGGVLETGSGVLANGDHGIGLIRVTPMIGAWINGLGYLRLGYGFNNYVQDPDEGEKEKSNSVIFLLN